MGVNEWANYQEKKGRREEGENLPLRHLYPAPKKDRMSDTGIQRLSGKGKKHGK